MKVLGRTCSETPESYETGERTKVLAEEFNSFLGDTVVVPVPAEGLAHVLLSEQGPHYADQVEIGHVQNLVFLEMDILSGDRASVPS